VYPERLGEKKSASKGGGFYFCTFIPKHCHLILHRTARGLEGTNLKNLAVPGMEGSQTTKEWEEKRSASAFAGRGKTTGLKFASVRKKAAGG